MRLLLPGEVAERHDADQLLVAVDDDDAPNLTLAHEARRLVDVIVLEAIRNVGGHDIAHARARDVATFSDAADGDVAVGDGADDAFAVADRQKSNVLSRHLLRGFCDRLVGADHGYLVRHQVFDGHFVSSSNRRFDTVAPLSESLLIVLE